ncbi:MAG: xanthine dehydrogenase family protein molybdopterin-binding subunit [bacterium]
MREDTPAEELDFVGKETKRIDVIEKMTGKAIYTGDIQKAGMLHAKVKRSPHARAKIVRIDTTRAEKMPGVHAVLTGKGCDNKLGKYKLGLYLVDKDVLAKERVRHYGEAVAAVAAETPELAQKAVDKIEVEYEVEKPVLDAVEAVKEEAPLVHPDLEEYDYMESAFTPQPGTNIANHTKIRKGDVEKGFEEADHVFEREYTNPNVQHVPMETHIAIAQWREQGKIDVYTSAQSPFTVRNLLCVAFGLSHKDVRVQVPHVGGGFGGKAGIGVEPLACCLSRIANGRPVKLQATREEEFSLLPCRSGLTYRIKTGINNDGKIVAQKMTMYWDSGAYADYAVNVTRASAYSASGPYEIPNAWVDAYTVYTNKPYGTAYRGFGHVEFSWGAERHINYMAEKLGIDPLELRRKNALKPDAITLTGEKITENTGDVIKCMNEAAKAINYGELTEEEKKRENQSGRKIAKAVAALHKAPAMPSFTATSAVVKLNEDGSVIADVSLTDYGQGTYTSLAQMIAEELRIPVEKINMSFEGDTEKGTYDWQTVASKGLLMSGNACILACKDLLEKAYGDAGEILRANPCDLDHKDGKIFIKHHPKKYVTFADLSVGYAYPSGEGIGGPLVGVGRYMAQGLTSLDKETGQGLPALDWTYGAHGVIVSVDPETGEFDILKVASAFDVGKTINPGAVRGQIIGGMLQGLGTAVCEGYIYDGQGHLLNPSFTDNKIPTSLDIPEEIEGIVIETPQIDGPYGARGVGEHGMIALCGAIGNAIYKAVGADLTHMPIRDEDVWWALPRNMGKEKEKARYSMV